MFETNEPPKDIFEKVEPVASPPGGPSLPVSDYPTTLPPSDADLGHGGHGWKIAVIFLFAAIIIIGVAAGAYYLFFQNEPVSEITPTPPASKTSTGATTSTKETIPSGSVGSTTPITPTAPTGSPSSSNSDVAVLDSDGDGLANDEELEYGTSVTKPDTDSDGLGDREEIKVYGTDPRRFDTDSDTYSDGQEVRSGYNPNGTGKLLELPIAN